MEAKRVDFSNLIGLIVAIFQSGSNFSWVSQLKSSIQLAFSSLEPSKVGYDSILKLIKMDFPHLKAPKKEFSDFKVALVKLT